MVKIAVLRGSSIWKNFLKNYFVNTRITKWFVGIGHTVYPQMKLDFLKFSWNATTVVNIILQKSEIGMNVTNLFLNTKTKNGLILASQYYKIEVLRGENDI